jgi:integral membrane protein (TIGR01906 family)
VRGHGPATALTALALPFALVGNALLVLAWGWLPRALYALPGFPDDPLGLRGADRLGLAQVGVDAIQPWDASGLDRLRAARLPDGAVAVTPEEITHMDDVRSVVTLVLVAWLVALVVLGLVWLRRRDALREGLRVGGLLTLGLIGAAALAMAVDWEAFFTAFHGIFFEGDSWRFADEESLRRLYPYAFWQLAGGVLVALVVAQAVALWALARRR